MYRISLQPSHASFANASPGQTGAIEKDFAAGSAGSF